MFDFIGTLSESHLIPSIANLRRYRADELADLVVLYVCTLYILYSHDETNQQARNYARRTLAHGITFERWQTGGTDLYVMLYGLKADDVELDDQDASDRFKSVVPLGETLLVRWLREMAADNIHDYTHRALFTRLDFNFKIGNSSIRAVRRLVMDWDNLDDYERRLAVTRLLQLMRSRAPRGELLATLRRLADHHDLEIEEVCDLETGEGCGVKKTYKPSARKPVRKGGSFLATLAGVAAGVAVSNAMNKKDRR